MTIFCGNCGGIDVQEDEYHSEPPYSEYYEDVHYYLICSTCYHESVAYPLSGDKRSKQLEEFQKLTFDRYKKVYKESPAMQYVGSLKSILEQTNKELLKANEALLEEYKKFINYKEKDISDFFVECE